jgi:hypothetical protein
MYFCLNFMINLDSFLDIVSAQAPNLLNIILWCRRRTFLCVNTWPIIKFEIGSVADFSHGNQKSKPAFSHCDTRHR